MQCVKESCYWAVLQTANHCAIVHVRTQIHMICTVMYKYRWRDLPSDLSQMNVKTQELCMHTCMVYTYLCSAEYLSLALICCHNAHMAYNRNHS